MLELVRPKGKKTEKKVKGHKKSKYFGGIFILVSAVAIDTTVEWIKWVSHREGVFAPEFMWQFFINAYTTLFLIIKCTTLLWFIRKTWFSFFIPSEIIFLHVLSNSDEIAVTKS